MKAGDQVLVTGFFRDGRVDVIGTSRGSGFRGVMKRHNFSGSSRRTVRCSIGLPDPRFVVSVARHPGHYAPRAGMGGGDRAHRNLKIVRGRMRMNNFARPARCGFRAPGSNIVVPWRRHGEEDHRAAARKPSKQVAKAPTKGKLVNAVRYQPSADRFLNSREAERAGSG